MRGIDINTGWTCRHLEDTGTGMPVSIPDDAMLREERRADAAGGLNVSWFEGRDYLYTRTLTLTAQEARRHNVLEFEGVYRKGNCPDSARRTGTLYRGQQSLAPALCRP